MTQPLQLTAYTAVSAFGYGLEAMKTSLLESQTGLSLCDFPHCDLSTYIGRIKNIEQVELPTGFTQVTSRNNQIAFAALQQDGFIEEVERCKQQYGDSQVGLVFASSTSGFYEFENAFRDTQEHQTLPKSFNFKGIVDFYATTKFICEYLDISGHNFTINTACSSSAKAFISASRMLQTGLCDAVIVAGVDSLCLNTLYGFNSLELLSKNKCRPCDENRDGLNIGEAGAFVLLERSRDKDKIHLLGYGESTDAHHMSTPHPMGLGAKHAMEDALKQSKLLASQIDYINLHGTATPANDASEIAAINSIFSNRTPCSSTKGWGGHTLGAAGALEAIVSCLAIEMQMLPGSLNTRTIDPELEAQIILDNTSKKVTKVLSNSFGFGGNNCSLILGREHAV